jgi:8-oxo-dGTP pyrophosphatase MutT (NUDIX family)
LSDDIREFGEPVAGANYVDRPSAYAVIFRGDLEVAVVSTPRGIFLPGGGREGGETAMQTVIRESSEECGLRVTRASHLGVADQLVFTFGSTTGLRKRCTFFVAEVDSVLCERREADHTLLWLSLDDASRLLSHESHRWAVAEAAA